MKHYTPDPPAERAQITPEERALIEAAIAAGKLKRIPQGVSSYNAAEGESWRKKHNTIARKTAIAQKRRAKVRAMHAQGKTTRETAEALGVSIGMVGDDIRALGLMHIRPKGH